MHIRYPLVLCTMCIIFISCIGLNLYMVTGFFWDRKTNIVFFYYNAHYSTFYYYLLLFTIFPEEDYKCPPVTMLIAPHSVGRIHIPSLLTQAGSC